jgi:hypothetical protein
MNKEERKKFLVLACACDRVELSLIWRRPARALAGVAGFVSNPWVQAATSVVTPFLPRKFRAASALFSLWKSRG